MNAEEVKQDDKVCEYPGSQGALQRLDAGVGRAHPDDIGTLPQGFDGNLNGKILLGLNDRACLVKVIDQHPSACPLALEQAAVPHQGGEIGAGRVRWSCWASWAPGGWGWAGVISSASW